jgi:hypothetical protein
MMRYEIIKIENRSVGSLYIGLIASFLSLMREGSLTDTLYGIAISNGDGVYGNTLEVGSCEGQNIIVSVLCCQMAPATGGMFLVWEEDGTE